MRPIPSCSRRDFLRSTALGGALTVAGSVGYVPTPHANEETQGADGDTFGLHEASISQLLDDMAAGRRTAREVADAYMARIDQLDRQGPMLRAVIEVNPDAVSIAEALDGERAARGPRGPLHGIPVLLKDNIDTADRMTTTAGLLGMAGLDPGRRFVCRPATAGRRCDHPREGQSE